MINALHFTPIELFFSFIKLFLSQRHAHERIFQSNWAKAREISFAVRKIALEAISLLFLRSGIKIAAFFRQKTAKV